jgi:hypothetical protein
MQINAYQNTLSSVSAEFKNSAQIERKNSSQEPDQAAELSKGFGAILDKARVEPDGSDAVAQARQALADGTLETEKAFESAANGLLNFGI